MASTQKKSQILQEVIFSGRISGANELFVRGNSAVNDGNLIIPKGETVFFDTYYNSFQIDAWKKYTNVNECSLSLNISGKGYVCAFVEGFDDVRKEIGCIEFDSNDNQFLEVSFDSFSFMKYNGILFFGIQAERETVIRGGCYFSRRAPGRNVSIAGCFCTYHREEDLKRNVQCLTNGTNSDVLSCLYVIDNGNSLEISDEEFQDLRVQLIANPNYGGSAGYARGMMEVLSNGSFSHILLMDDDAIIEPFVIKKLKVFLDNLNEDYQESSVGAARFSLEQPWLQESNLGNWSPKSSVAFGTNKDMRLFSNLFNDIQTQPNYIAWFFACIPVTTLRNFGLPLPFFFQHDDVEYGQRSLGPYITVNGLNVWHPSPKYSQRPYAGYYSARNDLIIISEYFPSCSRYLLAFKLMKHTLSFISSYRYEEAASYIQGYKDFYRGPIFFEDEDPEVLNNSLIEKYSYTQVTSNLLGEVRHPIPISRERRALARLVNLLPLRRKACLFPYKSDWMNLDLLGFSDIYFIDGDRVFRVSKNYKRAVGLLVDSFKTAVIAVTKNNVRVEWKKACARYRKKDYWRKLLSI
jgi:GT2 family glycosyltransferase